MPSRFPQYRLISVFALALGAYGLVLAPHGALADVEAGVRAFQEGDYQAAIDEWRVDAAQGNANALFNLGQAYRLGRGVPADIDQAETYYLRASRAGHPAAMGNLATLYYFSKTPPRVDDAVYWWQMGAEAGDPRSQYILGAMTFNGDPVKKDLPKAYAWTWLAAQAGLEEAKTALATMRPYVDEPVRKEAEATARDLMTESGKTYWQTQLPNDAAAPSSETMVAQDATPAPTEPAPTPDVEPSEAPVPTPEAEPSPAPQPAAAQTPSGGPAYRINLASMGSREDAESARRSVMTDHGDLVAALPLRIVETEQGGRTLFRLQAGRYAKASEAQAACTRMKSGGLDCFILRTAD